MTMDAEAARDELYARISAVLGDDLPEADEDDTCEAAFRQRRSIVPTRDQELSGAAPGSDSDVAAIEEAAECDAARKFLPLAPASLRESGLTENEIEALLLKSLAGSSTASGAALSDRVALPFPVVNKFLTVLKTERLVAVKNTSSLHDFVYELTELGAQRARAYLEQSPYCGAAPVPLAEYASSVAAQSLSRFTPTREDLQQAFADLYLSPAMFERLGRAIYAGKGLFLHGAPGNGKTSLAERVTKAYGQSIWIPRALSAWGETIRLFDPSHHEELPLSDGESVANDQKIDRRWIRIRRPTIVVGGELTLDNLEITSRKEAGISEAPLQLKSNCGTLVIDDFGRQRVSPADLLNRWIVPLEKRYDFLNLLSGRKIRVPFDQFLVFSTNLEPRDLVDEAFLRRIPYKIDAQDPSEEEFRNLFEQTAVKMGIEFSADVLDHLITTHYRPSGRPFRFCHPRDLLRQVSVFCQFRQAPPELTTEAIDTAAGDYFAVL